MPGKAESSRDGRCATCRHSTMTDNPLRVLCHHEPMPVLQATAIWPRMFHADGCGYWSAQEATP